MSPFNFRLSCLVTMVTILVGSHVSFISARLSDKSTRLQAARIHKRDASPTDTPSLGTGGLEMACQLHPRNCPGGFVKREQTLLERLRQVYPNTVYATHRRPSETDSSFNAQEDQDPAPGSSISLRSNRGGVPSDSPAAELSGMLPLGSSRSSSDSSSSSSSSYASLDRDYRLMTGILELLTNVRSGSSRQSPSYSRRGLW